MTLEGGAGRVAIALVCAQSFTYTYASISSYLGGAGFVKVNLNPLDWRDPADRAAFLDDWRRRSSAATPSRFLGADAAAAAPPPAGARLHIDGARSPGFARELEGRFGCPVLDLYSLNECRLVAPARNRAPRRAAGTGSSRTTCTWRCSTTPAAPCPRASAARSP